MLGSLLYKNNFEVVKYENHDILYLTKVLLPLTIRPMKRVKAWKTQPVNELLEAVLKLNNSDEAEKFFRDLLTEPELAEFANRWKVARMLSENVPYSRIEKQTGMSSTTIARISKWLNTGMGGYTLMLKKLNQNHHHGSDSSLEDDS